ncbi:canonical purine NTP phosphatase [Seminavis robusta]|uniref:inosine/xanthosine triphosphatase n=1 Tax=Seminavis robusta TaxID=568900 RepID=A0A9N8HGE1_9STRA|nr:canonical purine NTP phosphatase [Seminavis robusta]|eukprot:Sro627_g177910.1 canonical purine NTP phosphatase (276) ;mRNA; r:38197-39024
MVEHPDERGQEDHTTDANKCNYNGDNSTLSDKTRGITMAATTGEASGEEIVLRIAVGSGNPCKVQSVVDALNQVIQTASQDQNNPPNVKLEVESFNVESGVAAQPMGDEETQLGAKNRALGAYKNYETKFQKPPHFAFGLEGGLEWSQDKSILWCMAWMSCYGKREKIVVDLLGASNMMSTLSNDQADKLVWGLAKTASFPIPPPVTDLVKQGLELGHADDKVFSRVNSKQGSGTVGILSNGIIDRAAYYTHAIILSLCPWIRADVYPEGCTSKT